MKELFRKAILWTGVSVSCVLSFAIVTRYLPGTTGVENGLKKGGKTGRQSVTLLAFGDVNLGRLVGQRILKDEIGYPFQKIALKPGSADIVFANLESELSDQNGETQDPHHNMIFTGPPNGAFSLASFGFTVVSTANNHAYDYGRNALFETLKHLDDQNIAHAGTVRSAGGLYEPLMFEKKGIRFALFAATDLMNFKGGWHEYVATTDTAKLFPAIREAAASVDVVIVSVHGGDEYADEPTKHIREFAEQCVRQGVRIVLGHHPHVPYGVELIGNSYIFHSLGNFVFYQPQLYWTQVSYAVELELERIGSTVSITSVNCIPLKAGYQPSILTDSSALAMLQHRVQSNSNIPIMLTKKGYLN